MATPIWRSAFGVVSSPLRTDAMVLLLLILLLHHHRCADAAGAGRKEPYGTNTSSPSRSLSVVSSTSTNTKTAHTMTLSPSLSPTTSVSHQTVSTTDTEKTQSRSQSDSKSPTISATVGNTQTVSPTYGSRSPSLESPTTSQTLTRGKSLTENRGMSVTKTLPRLTFVKHQGIYEDALRTGYPLDDRVILLQLHGDSFIQQQEESREFFFRNVELDISRAPSVVPYWGVMFTIGSVNTNQSQYLTLVFFPLGESYRLLNRSVDPAGEWITVGLKPAIMVGQSPAVEPISFAIYSGTFVTEVPSPPLEGRKLVEALDRSSFVLAGIGGLVGNSMLAPLHFSRLSAMSYALSCPTNPRSSLLDGSLSFWAHPTRYSMSNSLPEDEQWLGPALGALMMSLVPSAAVLLVHGLVVLLLMSIYRAEAEYQLALYAMAVAEFPSRSVPLTLLLWVYGALWSGVLFFAAKGTGALVGTLLAFFAWLVLVVFYCWAAAVSPAVATTRLHQSSHLKEVAAPCASSAATPLPTTAANAEGKTDAVDDEDGGRESQSAPEAQSAPEVPRLGTFFLSSTQNGPANNNRATNTTGSRRELFPQVTRTISLSTNRDRKKQNPPGQFTSNRFLERGFAESPYPETDRFVPSQVQPAGSAIASKGFLSSRPAAVDDESGDSEHELDPRDRLFSVKHLLQKLFLPWERWRSLRHHDPSSRGEFKKKRSSFFSRRKSKDGWDAQQPVQVPIPPLSDCVWRYFVRRFHSVLADQRLEFHWYFIADVLFTGAIGFTYGSILGTSTCDVPLWVATALSLFYWIATLFYFRPYNGTMTSAMHYLLTSLELLAVLLGAIGATLNSRLGSSEREEGGGATGNAHGRNLLEAGEILIFISVLLGYLYVASLIFYFLWELVADRWLRGKPLRKSVRLLPHRHPQEQSALEMRLLQEMVSQRQQEQEQRRRADVTSSREAKAKASKESEESKEKAEQAATQKSIERKAKRRAAREAILLVPAAASDPEPHQKNLLEPSRVDHRRLVLDGAQQRAERYGDLYDHYSRQRTVRRTATVEGKNNHRHSKRRRASRRQEEPTSSNVPNDGELPDPFANLSSGSDSNTVNVGGPNESLPVPTLERVAAPSSSTRTEEGDDGTASVDMSSLSPGGGIEGLSPIEAVLSGRRENRVRPSTRGKSLLL